MPDDTLVDSLKLPPHSVEAEQSVLGGLLLDNEAADRVGDVLSSDDFYSEAHRVVYRIETLYNRDDPSDVTGVPTGFTDLDRMTSGLQPGDLVVVAGRPSMGKTAFALNIGEHVALAAGLPVAVF